MATKKSARQPAAAQMQLLAENEVDLAKRMQKAARNTPIPIAKPFDPTKPVETRDGRKARILCVDAKQDVGSILALVTQKDGFEEPFFYNEDGLIDAPSEHPTDLVNAPERKTVTTQIRVRTDSDRPGRFVFREIFAEVTYEDGVITKIEVLK